MRRATQKTRPRFPRRSAEMNALVTGATSGLGQVLWRLLQEKNYRVFTTGRHPLPHQNHLVLDLSKDRKPLLDLIRKETFDLVINNAGYTFYGPALNFTTEEQLDILEVNATAAIEITLEAARSLLSKKKRGIILNVSSLAGEFSIPNMAMYAAAKACLTSFSLGLDAEMKPQGIRILSALPGPFETPFAARASKGKYQSSGKGLSAEKVAEAIWSQIERNNPYQIIGGKFKFYLSRCLPRSILDQIFLRSLRHRFF